MDELFNPKEFLVQLPLWFLSHPDPAKMADGLIRVTGPSGQQATPLFTDEDLANRFLAALPPLRDYLAVSIDNGGRAIAFFDLLKSKGFTHVTIDQRQSLAGYYAIGDLRDRFAGDVR